MLINLIIRYLKLKLFIRIWIFILEMKKKKKKIHAHGTHTDTMYCRARQLKRENYGKEYNLC